MVQSIEFSVESNQVHLKVKGHRDPSIALIRGVSVEVLFEQDCCGTIGFASCTSVLSRHKYYTFPSSTVNKN